MEQKNDVVKVENMPPTGIQVVIREFRKDKLALLSFIGITLLIIVILIMSAFMNQDEILRIKLLERFTEPGVNGYILGADEAGRDMYGQLIIGAKNSILIAVAITLIANA